MAVHSSIFGSLVLVLGVKAAVSGISPASVVPTSVAQSTLHSRDLDPNNNAHPPWVSPRKLPNFNYLAPEIRRCFVSAYEISSAGKDYWRNVPPARAMCVDNLSNMLGTAARCVGRSKAGALTENIVTAHTQRDICIEEPTVGDRFAWTADNFVEAARAESFVAFYAAHPNLRPSNAPKMDKEFIFTHEFVDTTDVIVPQWEGEHMTPVYLEGFVDSPCAAKDVAADVYDCLAKNEGDVLAKICRQVAARYFLEEPRSYAMELLNQTYDQLEDTVRRGLGRDVELGLRRMEFWATGMLLPDLQSYHGPHVGITNTGIVQRPQEADRVVTLLPGPEATEALAPASSTSWNGTNAKTIKHMARRNLQQNIGAADSCSGWKRKTLICRVTRLISL